MHQWLFGQRLLCRSRHRILDEMVEQRQQLELFYMNDTVEVQNRILRQINDFLLVLAKAACEHLGTAVSEFTVNWD